MTADIGPGWYEYIGPSEVRGESSPFAVGAVYECSRIATHGFKICVLCDSDQFMVIVGKEFWCSPCCMKPAFGGHEATIRAEQTPADTRIRKPMKVTT